MEIAVANKAAALHVVAGVLRDPQGRVLLAQRPPGKHLAGTWEFPGGKREPGELPCDALVRELREELGIVVEHAEPMIQVPWASDGFELLLDAWHVHAWKGTPQSVEGQALRWADPAGIDADMMPPADRPILSLLRGG